MSTLKKSENEKFAAKWVPNKWEYLELTEFAKLYKVKIDPLNSSSNYKCLELEHFEEGTGRINGFTQIRAQKSIKNKFEVGHVLFGKLRPYLRKFWLATFSGVCSSEVWVLTGTKKKCDNAFLFYLVQHSRFIQSANVSTGTKMPRADWDYVSEFPFPLPPLPEQRKIALIFSTWDRAIEKTEQLIAQKQELKKGLMQVLLTGKVRFKEFKKNEWKLKMLSDCINGKGCYGINAESVAYDSSLPTYLRITDIDESGRYISGEKVSVNNPESKSFYLSDGDIVFARTGNTTGKTYLYDKKDGKLVYAGFLIKFSPQKQILLPAFLKFFAETNSYWNWVHVVSMRSGQPGINAQEYGELQVPTPSISEQQRIVDILTGIDIGIHNLIRTKGKFNDQKKGLMQKLLTGRVRVKLL